MPSLQKTRLLASVSLIAFLAAGLPAPTQAGDVLPTSGSVAAGSATISAPKSGNLTINQTSSSAVVNWNSFSVGAGNSVTFVQPNAQSSTLNRVTGTTTSTIAGQISANGSVVLVNPNGIQITPTGSVKTQSGFVASTLDTADADFMAGKRIFTGTGQSAAVDNQGRIVTGPGGFVALLGGTVSNSGLISAPLGKIGLGSGEQATLDVNGDQFLQVAVPTNAQTADGQALITNSGKIRARGGQVILTAATAKTAVREAINMPGSISASSVHGHSGSITFGGGPGGKVRVSGKLGAASRRSTGGTVTITGHEVALKKAVIDVSGATGGGTVTIGGKDSTLQAAAVSIDATSAIHADGTHIGNGGNVVIWSTGLSAVHGVITALGGPSGGNGGFVETSGETVNFDGITVNTAAAHGLAGSWLIDPVDLTIDANAATAINAALVNNSVTLTTSTSGNPTAAGVTGATGNTTGSGLGDITVTAPISWSSNNGLTLTAAHAINILAPITVNGGGQVTLNYDVASPTNLSFGLTTTGFTGSLNFASGQTGQTLTINGTPYTLIYNLGAGSDGLRGMNASGNNALAASQDAAGLGTLSASLVPLLTGNFEGLGHTVANLRISSSSLGVNVGLFGASTGSVRDFGSVGGAVAGDHNSDVGGLVGQMNGGALTNVYSTASVSALPGANDGGLVGTINTGGGAITNAFATGTVGGSGDWSGGFVGELVAGSIANAFATGQVLGGGYSGGFVGRLTGGAITDAFAAGSVAGSGAGGFIGLQAGGATTNTYATGSSTNVGFSGNGLASATNAYFDTGTTGRSAGAGGGSTTGLAQGLTTAQLQSGVATFSGTAWGGGTGGLYPYLKSFYPNGVQAVSGTAYKADLTPAASNANGIVTVSLDAGGRRIGTAATGANGYYYIALPGTPLTNGATILASTPAAATLATSSGATAQSGVDLLGGFLATPTAATALSAAPGLATFKANATATAGSDAAAAAVVAGLSSPGYLATGASFAIDAANINASIAVSTTAGAPISIAGPLTVGNGATLALVSGGAFNVTAPVRVDSGAFRAATSAGAAMSVAAPVTAASGSALSLISSGALTITAAVQANGAVPVTLSGTSLSFGLTATGFTGGLTFANADGTAATSAVAGQSLAINGAAYTLIYNFGSGADGLRGVGGFQNSALAGSLAATALGTLSAAPVGSFSVTFEGLGHTIANLTVAAGTGNGGLFASFGGTLSDIGMVGGTVSGANAGGIAGVMNGTLANVYATDAVSGTTTAGGLAGSSVIGTISNAFATGAVSGGANAFVGGLVAGGASSILTLSNVYATGAVSGGDGASVGGLVGAERSSLNTNVYATGTVTGGANAFVGGLVGVATAGSFTNVYATGAVNGGTGALTGGLLGKGVKPAGGRGSVFPTITNGYYDATTSGKPAGAQVQGVAGAPSATGLTTAQMQGGSVTFSGNAWAGGAGLYPYLASFFPNGAQAISGYAYQFVGATNPLASTAAGVNTVGVAVGGFLIGQMSTGANGYFYAALPAGSLGAGQRFAAFTQANAVTGAADAATYATTAAGNTSVTVYGGWRLESANSATTTLSALNAADAAVAGTTAAASVTPANREIDFAAPAFALDAATNLTGTLALSGLGRVTQSAAITAQGLSLGGGAYTLTNAGNAFGMLQANAASVAVFDTTALTIGAGITTAGPQTAGVAASATTGTPVSIVAQGPLAIARGATVTSGASILLASGSSFTNGGGANALTLGAGGRFLIYSQDAANPTGVLPTSSFGGLTATNWYNDAYDFTTQSFASAPPATGNRFVYGYAAKLGYTLSGTAVKTYDGTTAATVSNALLQTSGVRPGDSAFVAATGYSYDNANAGTAKTVTATGLAFTSNPNNYALSATPASGQFGAINPLAVILTGSQTYNGGTTIQGSNLSVSNAVQGDTVTVGGTSAVASANAGPAAQALASLSNLTLSNTNYALAGGSGTVTINPLAVTLTGSQVYNATTIAPAASFSSASGLQGSDTLTSLGLSGFGTLAAGNVGSEALNLTGGLISGLFASNTNYKLTGGTVTVMPATLTYVATPVAMVSGTPLPALDGRVTGFVGADTLASATTGRLTWSTLATSTSAAGIYAILGAGLTANNANYLFAQAPGNATALTVNTPVATVNTPAPTANTPAPTVNTPAPTATVGMTYLPDVVTPANPMGAGNRGATGIGSLSNLTVGAGNQSYTVQSTNGSTSISIGSADGSTLVTGINLSTSDPSVVFGALDQPPPQDTSQ